MTAGAVPARTPPDPIKARPGARTGASRAIIAFVWTACAFAFVAVAANGTAGGDPSRLMGGLGALLEVTVGATLVSRLPGNLVGWLLWLGGLLAATTLGTGGLATYGLVTQPGSVPGAIWLAWVSAWSGAPPLFITAVFLPLVYPTGRFLSPRWRVVATIGAMTTTVLTLENAFGRFSPGSYPPAIENPLLLTGPAADLLAAAYAVVSGDFGAALLAVALLASVASIVIRYRRSSGVERQQVKWFAYVATVIVVSLGVAFGGLAGGTDGLVGTIDNLAWLATFTAIALLPVAIGIAILRYRLYEIDRLVSRTISWAIVSAIVGGLFIGLVLVLQVVLAPVTQTSELAVAASTLAVAALFQPLRGRVQRLVDRRFNRSRVDAERAVSAFTGRLRDEVDLAQLGAEVTATVSGTLQPVSVALWLRS